MISGINIPFLRTEVQPDPPLSRDTNDLDEKCHTKDMALDTGTHVVTQHQTSFPTLLGRHVLWFTTQSVPVIRWVRTAALAVFCAFSHHRQGLGFVCWGREGGALEHEVSVRTNTRKGNSSSTQEVALLSEGSRCRTG